MTPEIHIEDFAYMLPEERIAKYPLSERDASRLLVYRDGMVADRTFRQLPEELPADCLMVFNDTKVIPARLFFRRPTGAHIEIFCLEPVCPSEYNLAFSAMGSCRWKCVIGNAKRWKDDTLVLENACGELENLSLEARLVGREGQSGIVEFRWQGQVPFSRVLELCGRIPIPPYLNRETESLDLERYQTLYAQVRGSVAAPTAGLHFTQRVMDALDARGIQRETVCLHVGAGTFLPVKSSLVSEHPMHREPFVVSRALLCKLRDASQPVVAVGTTSVRTLESLYYAGAQCIDTGCPEDVAQWIPYEREFCFSRQETLGALVEYLDRQGSDTLQLGTRIIIVPGFRFRVVDAMVTNFHQPKSTLLLLISAFVGGDWHRIYDHALAHGYRFLSYGDSSLLFRR